MKKDKYTYRRTKGTLCVRTNNRLVSQWRSCPVRRLVHFASFRHCFLEISISSSTFTTSTNATTRMDHPHHHPHHPMDGDPNMPPANAYGFYASDQEQSYAMAYPHPQMPPYQVQVQHSGPQARACSTFASCSSDNLSIHFVLFLQASSTSSTSITPTSPSFRLISTRAPCIPHRHRMFPCPFRPRLRLRRLTCMTPCLLRSLAPTPPPTGCTRAPTAAAPTPRLPHAETVSSSARSATTLLRPRPAQTAADAAATRKTRTTKT